MIISDKALWYKRGRFKIDNQSLLSTDEALDRLQDIRISLPG